MVAVLLWKIRLLIKLVFPHLYLHFVLVLLFFLCRKQINLNSWINASIPFIDQPHAFWLIIYMCDLYFQLSSSDAWAKLHFIIYPAFCQFFFFIYLYFIYIHTCTILVAWGDFSSPPCIHSSSMPLPFKVVLELWLTFISSNRRHCCKVNVASAGKCPE